MSNILRTDENLFQDLFDVRRGFERMFDRMSDRMLTGFPVEKTPFKPANFQFTPAVEAYIDKEGKKFYCRIALPGIDPKDVQIHVQNNILTVVGERHTTHQAKNVDRFAEEILYGSFTRVMELPEGVQNEKLNAEFNRGVLEITAPVAAAALPRKVEIKAVMQTPKSIAA